MKRIIPAAKAIIFQGASILIVRQNHNGIVYWDLPGGKIECGETPLEALKREVWEEVGLEVVSSKFVGTWRFFGKHDGDYQIECLTYECGTSTQNVDIGNNPGDHIEHFEWVEKQVFLSDAYPVAHKSLKDMLRSSYLS
ncbi:MAG: NUDIX hydrolase [Patescibacteria group bacterium]|jgi:8-oxo-dGTP pyrophosphatase MutT (NUDIX family)